MQCNHAKGETLKWLLRGGARKATAEKRETNKNKGEPPLVEVLGTEKIGIIPPGNVPLCFQLLCSL
jgi:hypothetical protein